MRSMQWQLGMLGTISAFAYRHRETKKQRQKKMTDEKWPFPSCTLNAKQIQCSSQVDCVSGTTSLHITLHLLEAARPCGQKWKEPVATHPDPPSHPDLVSYISSSPYRLERPYEYPPAAPAALDISPRNVLRKPEPKSLQIATKQ